MKSQVREVLKATDDNHMTLEWYENQGGGEKKTMEINYTRAGKSDGYNCGSRYRIAESCSGSRVCRKQSDARFALLTSSSRRYSINSASDDICR